MANRFNEGVSSEYIRQILRYDPANGIFMWNNRPVRPKCERMDKTWNTRFAGKVAGSLGGDGYIQIDILSHPYKAHRIAWVLMTGEWPKHQIDHINMNKTDNRWNNLRKATNMENGANRGCNSNNTSGLKGVSWSINRAKWQVGIKVNGKRCALGYFDCPAAAHFAYVVAADKHFGEFARSA